MDGAKFVKLAMSIGVARRIDELTADCDQAIASLSVGGDARWLWRLEDQRRLLGDPTLRVIVAIATKLVEERPEHGPSLAPALATLLTSHPELSRFHERMLYPKGPIGRSQRESGGSRPAGAST